MKPVRIACVSDIHLGHQRTSTEFIIDNLNKYLTCDSFFMKIDLLFLAGDVYDRLLAHNSLASKLIDAWIARLLRLAKKHNVIIIVLEGTPLHDSKQPSRFMLIHEIHQKSKVNDVNIRYVDKISVEYIEEYDLHLLCVPDEINHTTDVTLDECRKIIASKGLSQVDIAIMHGAFRYQLPILSALKTHDEQAYQDLVKYLIYIGHVHKRSTFGKIVAQGSFDRLSQGEEEAKGFVYSVFDEYGNHQTKFIDNPTAKRYVTIDCKFADVEDSIRHIDNIVQTLPSDSFLRIRSNYANPILANIGVLQSRWPTMRWESCVDEEKEQNDIELEIENEQDYVALSVTADNIRGLLNERLLSKGVSSEILARCNVHIEDLEQL